MAREGQSRDQQATDATGGAASDTAEGSAYASLSPQHQAYVDAYVGLAGGNATEAARLAGFKGDKRESLAQQGSRLYRNVEIRAAIQERVSELALTAEEVLSRIGQQATASVEDFLRWTKDGWQLDLKKARRAKKLGLIKSLTPTRYGVKIELYDAQAALVHLGKYHKLWTENQNVTIDVSKLPTELLQKLADAP